MNAFQRCKNNKNRFIIAIVLKFRKLRRCQICFRFVFLKTQFFAKFASFQYDFDHNSMRQRRIFDIIDYLNNVHFVFQNKRLFVCFVYRMQMLSKCEIDKIAKRMRNIKILQFYQI